MSFTSCWAVIRESHAWETLSVSRGFRYFTFISFNEASSLLLPDTGGNKPSLVVQ